MRRSIRLALPAVAAATLLLSGCGDDDSDGGSPLSPGGDGGQEQEQGGDTGGEETSSGSDGEQTGDTGGDSGGDSGGQAGAAPSAEDLEGMWLEGYEEADSSLMFSSGSVTYIEDSGAEGDVCYGELSGGGFTVECSQMGTSTWPDTEATLTLDGGTLNVVWASGTTESYESIGDMGDLGDLGDLEQELEDLGY
ncbi:hypothetical protein [Streptomyces sp. NBC_01803]|uniref:hypothetical protein n=1 Tax=Streptomyces sp. NBC_01803 TaxID=2975946 RepID=UPI002DDB32C6|nr:hypothetical protein [Streptomyces sp. NBC_01803]WSA45719.1 hypothetical protein OIE51_16820 [Streptomyces sp. NBC_01803]